MLFIIGFFSSFLLTNSSFAQSNETIKNNLLNNIRTANLLVEARVISKISQNDDHNYDFEQVKFLVLRKLEGKSNHEYITLDYYLNSFDDQLFIKPDFELGKEYILVLIQCDDGKIFLPGGNLSRFRIEENKINQTKMTKIDFLLLLQRIRNYENSLTDIDSLCDLIDEIPGEEKLDGEFVIVHPDFKNKPKGEEPLLTFELNHLGAKDKDGVQLSFEQVRTALLNAISAWNSVSCSYPVFSISGTPYTGSGQGGDNRSTITFEHWQGLPNGRGFSMGEGQINEYDIVFNSELRWNTETTYPISYPTYAAPIYPPYQYFPTIGPGDLQDVATHEFGHAVGLDHVLKSEYTMYTTQYQDDLWWEKTYRRSLNAGDIAGKIYMDPDFSVSAAQPCPKMLLANQNYEPLSISGTLTVPANCYLEIEPLIGFDSHGDPILLGRELQFSPNASLTINGTLNAIGAGDDFNEQFKFWAIPNQSWGGLVFNSGSGGTIQYCNIRNAVTGIACYNTLPIIQHNSIFDNSTGISLYNIGTSSNEISYNLIQDNSSKGVYLSSASPKLYSNTITNNGQYGVYCYYNSSPYLYDNIISGHTGSGLYCTSYSSAKLVPWNASGCCWGHGDNNISNNSGRGINASYWSNLYLGSSPYGGFNSICDNTGYELSAMYSCNIMAEINWWGTSPEFYTYQSTFDNLPYLSNPPNGIQKASVTENGETSYQSINNGIDRNLEKAYMLQLEGKFDEAIAAYSNFINTKPSDPEAAYALVRIEECHRLSNKEGFLNYLNKDVKSLAAINNYLAVVLLELESQYFVKDEKYKEAIDNFQKINKEYNLNSYVDKYSIFNTGYIYPKFLNDVDNAVKSFEELTNKYPKDDLVGEFKYLLSGINPNMPKNSSLSTAILPSEFEVTQNYPNPFNPTTKISYQLPVDAPLTLKVYDLLGREVATLINEERQAGTHEVEFDANNLSSGVYLYKITINDFAKTMKMIGIKNYEQH